MNTARLQINYWTFFLGILVAVIGVAASIVTFQSPLMRMAGIAVCLCGVYLVKRSTNNERIIKKYPATPFDFWIYVLFFISLALSLLTYASLYIFKNPSDLAGTFIIYSFIFFALVTSLIGSFLFARFVFRRFR